MNRNPAETRSRGARIWHLALAVVAVGLILRFGLGALPDPAPHVTDADALPSPNPATATATQDSPPAQPPVEIVPFDVQGEVPGPLLTRILQRYLPESTADHADALRDTLPPSEDPRMIVIIPDESKPRF